CRAGCEPAEHDVSVEERRARVLQGPLPLFAGRRDSDASHSATLRALRAKGSHRRVLLLQLPVLAPDIQIQEPDPTLVETRFHALSRSVPLPSLRVGCGLNVHVSWPFPAPDLGAPTPPRSWRRSARRLP